MAIKKLFIGSNPPEGWLSVSPYDHNTKLQYKNCSIDEVYVDHQLENYSPDQLVETLTEWRRVICVGGKFTIAFTDIVRAVFLYQRSSISSAALDSAMQASRSALSKQRIENLLVMRYSKVYEVHQPLKEKQLWTTILSAQKEAAS